MKAALMALGACWAAGLAGAQERPEWDQEKAVAKVKGVLAVEAAGRPWDKVAWLTDIDQAVAEARKQDKPLFVYFFLKKNVGPKDAPC
jgi:hypothetical protein